MSDEYDGTDGVAEEVDDMPESLKEGMDEDEMVLEGEDISGAHPMENKDWIEPANNVRLEITVAKLDVYTPKDKDVWKLANLELWLRVGKEGVDGKGKYAGKMFFPRLLVKVNRDAYDFTKNAQGKPTTYYDLKTGGAFGDYNECLMALGFSTAPAPRNDKAFRDGLVGRSVYADITKVPREVKNEQGKYVKVTGEYENELRFKAAPKGASAQQVEAAAS